MFLIKGRCFLWDPQIFVVSLNHNCLNEANHKRKNTLKRQPTEVQKYSFRPLMLDRYSVLGCPILFVHIKVNKKTTRYHSHFAFLLSIDGTTPKIKKLRITFGLYFNLNGTSEKLYCKS